MKRLWIAAVCILIAGLIFSLWRVQVKEPEVVGEVRITIGDNVIWADLADTPEERARGLSGRAGLCPNCGLLFVFPEPGRPGFWMKDMSFSIDIIWIDSNKRIIGVEKSVAPETYPNIFYPLTDISYVLEVPAGFSEAHNIDINQTLFFES